MLALALAMSPGCGRATTSTAPAEEAARSPYPRATVPGAFVPPDAEQRRAAVGSLEGLRGRARRVFEEGEGMFDPVPRPAAGDWLDERAERFQTFERYRDRRKTHPDRARKTIALLEIGTFGDGSPSVAALTRYVEAYYGMPVRRMAPVTLEELDVEQRTHDGRLQLQAKQILERLRERKPEDAFALAAITMTDLYPDEEWNFVFGYARAADQVGVFSFHRFDPQTGAEAVLRRSANTLVHELGHMFGVSHCTHFHCVMNGHNHEREGAALPMHLCPVDLRKLQHSAGFDPIERYRALAGLDRELGFEAEAGWIERRLSFIEGRRSRR